VIHERLAAVHENDWNLFLEFGERGIVENIHFLPLEGARLPKALQLAFHLFTQATARLGINNNLIFRSQE
jgi:hypothetical protein